MLQQVIAISIIAYFVFKAAIYKREGKISANEFSLWMVFWSMAAVAVIFIRKIDAAVVKLGFSASGIDVLLYLAVVLLIYSFFRLRLNIGRIERDITKLTREIALEEKRPETTKK